MKCLSCDKILSDFEATRKYENGEFVDMCNSCLGKSDMGNIAIIERNDLAEVEDISEESSSEDGNLHWE